MNKAADIAAGIGASAGGLDAFHSFFANMPAGSGIAFIVVLHLPANRKSLLPEIIGRWTSMPVVEATDQMLLQPNCVYVPPPHTHAVVQDGYLRIRTPSPETLSDDRPIDGFFDSLATCYRENAIGIVLSGTGTDGALGLKAIRERGGFTLAQGKNGPEPQFGGMPAAAIATGAVDVIALVDAMPGHLLRQADARRTPRDLMLSDDEREAARLTICSIVRSQLGHDFSGYKDKTFMRRVQRRMVSLDIDTIAAYIEKLQAEPPETVMLFRDLLIRVTSFFRDSETFLALEREVIPRMFDGVHADGVIRVWVPGCATGEEAYSLAILLREQMERMRGPPKVQIFATDIDEPALATARAGRYPATLLEGLSEARRRRFFVASDSGYVVTKEMREMCTFAAHSLIRDPPFSRMHLISCRNLLIYLNLELQGRVIPAFHYSLVPKGILLLGSSETTARHDELFMALDKPARIFQRRDVRSPPLGITADMGKPAVTDDPATAVAKRLKPANASERTMSEKGDESKSEHDASAQAGRAYLTSLAGRFAQGARSRLLSAARRFNPGLLSAETVQHRLVEVQDELQALRKEHRTAVEELRSANEELVSVNEELQSTIEELETSKEEIQSVNEELHTVNTQLSEKVDELDRANSDLKNLFDSTEVATVFLDRHLIIRGFTPAVGAIYNLIRSDYGRPLTDIVSRVRDIDLRKDVRQVLDTLQPLERRVTRDDGKVHFIMRVLPYRGADSSVDGTLVTFVDVTSVVQAETHQRLLVDELNHRVKNMLTVVVSLAAQTRRGSGSLEEFTTAFMGRVQALTASYTLLSQANWVDVSLMEVLVEETRPFRAPGGANFVIEGPSVRLASQGVLAFGMAVHELATNAVKYGALSVPEGVVRVTWQIEQEAVAPQLVFEWLEQNGPHVSLPPRRGFGTSLIERGFAHELSGLATVEFMPCGLRATLRAPLGTAVYAPRAQDGSV